MHKIIRCLMLSLTILMPAISFAISFAESEEGSITIINYGHKVFSIEGVKYQIADRVVIKELYNEQKVWLFAQLDDENELLVEFSKGSKQPKQVTKAYLVPQ